MQIAKLQDLYDHEINFRIQCFWDGGFDAYLGDDWNGFSAKKSFRTFEEAEKWLIEQGNKLITAKLMEAMP